MSNQIPIYNGSCHCGNIGFRFRASQRPKSWTIRACQCGFCRAHGVRTTTDPNGSVVFQIQDESQLHRYRFGTKSAEFYICRQCGVYLAAVLSSDSGQFATLNVNTLQTPVQVADAIPISYDSESLTNKIARREQRWTPVVREN
ncbi:MAG: aldehyde-activating protein [Chloroflexota bacterium]